MKNRMNNYNEYQNNLYIYNTYNIISFEYLYPVNIRDIWYSLVILDNEYTIYGNIRDSRLFLLFPIY